MNPQATDKLHMDLAQRVALESGCPRTKVGCCVLLESGVCVLSFNGHASGGPNVWEDDGPNPEVIHAELNAFGKILSQGLSGRNSTVYLTMMPCLDCAKLLLTAKVKRVVYLDSYRLTTGVEYLRKYGVQIEKLSDVDYNPHRHAFSHKAQDYKEYIHTGGVILRCDC